MRSLFWLLLLGLLAIGVALLGRLSDGYVLWVVPPWRVEASFNLYVLAQLGVILLAYLLLRGIANTLSLPRVVGEFRARRARLREERLAIEALQSFWEGRYSHALKLAEKVGASGTADATSAAARGVAAQVGLRSAHALRDAERMAGWQERSEAMDRDGWRAARLMGEIRTALDAHDYAAAAAALGQLSPKERRQISAQRLAVRLAQGRGDWREMLRLVRQLEKHNAFTPEQAQPLRKRAHQGMLDTLRNEPVHLVTHWYEIPAGDRDFRMARQAARALVAADAVADAARLIEDYLDDHWEPLLLEDYMACAGGDILGRIVHCEKWLHAHPHDALLLLVLGRLCLQQQLWGKTQSYLEASLSVSPSRAAHLELARLLDRLGKTAEADRHFRAAAQCVDEIPQTQSRGDRKSV